MDVTAEHARVVASLIEKAETTPDSYPLSSNALRAACNQSTNRDPVVDYSEREVDAAMLDLREGGLARTVTGSGHRVGKHKHIVDEALGLDGAELAVLAVLVLRGAQTRNEITTRTERYVHGPGGDGESVDAAIDRLAARPEPLVLRLERRPGEREPRIDQCWVDAFDDAHEYPPSGHRQGTTVSSSPDESLLVSPPEARPTDGAALTDRVTALEAALAEQTRRLDALLDELGTTAPR